jgi:hypothetical protein
VKTHLLVLSTYWLAVVVWCCNRVCKGWQLGGVDTPQRRPAPQRCSNNCNEVSKTSIETIRNTYRDGKGTKSLSCCGRRVFSCEGGVLRGDGVHRQDVLQLQRCPDNHQRVPRRKKKAPKKLYYNGRGIRGLGCRGCVDGAAWRRRNRPSPILFDHPESGGVARAKVKTLLGALKGLECSTVHLPSRYVGVGGWL